MKIKGVITGDIIQSTRIKPENKQLVLDTIRNTVYEMEKWSKMKLEIFRGDSFQIVIDNPYEAVRIAILIRAGLQKSTPEGSEMGCTPGLRIRKCELLTRRERHRIRW
jgi:hypothetical protein